MPTLKDLSCWVETDHTPRLREYATAYGDNAVETFVAIPEELGPFSIKIQNTKFIWTGLAVVIFIDGVKQCSRIKVGMVDDPTDPAKWQKTFVMKRKEELLSTNDGRSLDRGWTFERLNLVEADAASNVGFEAIENVGLIEVVVLRCDDRREEHTKEQQDKNPVKNSEQTSTTNVREDVEDFWKLKRLTKPRKQSKDRVVTKYVPKKERDQESSIGGLFGLFDGAGDGRDMTEPFFYRSFLRSQLDGEDPPRRHWDRDPRPYHNSYRRVERNGEFVFPHGSRLRAMSDDTIPHERDGYYYFRAPHSKDRPVIAPSPPRSSVRFDGSADGLSPREGRGPSRLPRGYYYAPESYRDCYDPYYYHDEFNQRAENIERGYSSDFSPPEGRSRCKSERPPPPDWDFRYKYKDDDYVRRPQQDQNAEHIRRAVHNMMRAGVSRVPSRGTFDTSDDDDYTTAEEDSYENIRPGHYSRGRSRSRSRSRPRRGNRSSSRRRSRSRRAGEELREKIRVITQELARLSTAGENGHSGRKRSESTSKESVITIDDADDIHGCCRKCSFSSAHARSARTRSGGDELGADEADSGTTDPCSVHDRYDLKCCRCNVVCSYCNRACEHNARKPKVIKTPHRNAERDLSLSHEIPAQHGEARSRDLWADRPQYWSSHWPSAWPQDVNYSRANILPPTPAMTNNPLHEKDWNGAREQVLIEPDGQKYTVAIPQNPNGPAQAAYQLPQNPAAAEETWSTPAANQSWSNQQGQQNQQQEPHHQPQDSSQDHWNHGQPQDTVWGNDKQGSGQQHNDWNNTEQQQWNDNQNQESENNNNEDNGNWVDEDCNNNQNGNCNNDGYNNHEHNDNNDWDGKSARMVSRDNASRAKKKSDPVRPSAATISRPRPYWTQQVSTSTANTGKPRAIFCEEPLPKISKTEAESRHIGHQVRSGPGVEGKHRLATPEYMDQLDKPYAVFRFKYRSADKLRELLSQEDFRETVEDLRERLKAMTQEQIVAEYVQRAQEMEGDYGLEAKSQAEGYAAGLAEQDHGNKVEW